MGSSVLGGVAAGGGTTTVTKWAVGPNAYYFTSTAIADSVLGLTLAVTSGQVLRLHYEGIVSSATGGVMTPSIIYSGVTVGSCDTAGVVWTLAGVRGTIFGYAPSPTSPISLLTNGTGPSIAQFTAGNVTPLTLDINLVITGTGTLSVTPSWMSSVTSNTIAARAASLTVLS